MAEPTNSPSTRSTAPARSSCAREDDGDLRAPQRTPAATSAAERRRRISFWRVVRWVVALVVAWLPSRSCCSSSPRRSSSKVSNAADAQLGGAGYTLTTPNTILVLGSDARPKGTKEAGAQTIGQGGRARTRSC